MRSLQFIAATLALGATLVAALGTHALHELAPHDLACRGAVDGESADCGAEEADTDAGGLVGCSCRRPDDAAIAVAESEARATPEAGSAAHDEQSCAICRHLWNAGSVVELSTIQLGPQPVALLLDRYVSPHAPAVSVGWHSRGPPGSV